MKVGFIELAPRHPPPMLDVAAAVGRYAPPECSPTL
jgi:hypothetical protein